MPNGKAFPKLSAWNQARWTLAKGRSRISSAQPYLLSASHTIFMYMESFSWIPLRRELVRETFLIYNMSNFFQFDNNMAIILAETCQTITEYMQIFKKDNKNDVANCMLFFKNYNRLLWRQCSLSTFCLDKNPVRQGLPVWFSNICDICSIKMKLILTLLYLHCIFLSVLMFVWINLNIPHNLNFSTWTELTSLMRILPMAPLL